MKLRKVKIVVEPFQKTGQRWLKGLRGKNKSKSREEVITVASWEILGKILSSPRLQILAAISIIKPKSILGLAKSMKKDFKNVYSDVRFLADLGLIELRKEGAGRKMAPVTKYIGIEFALAA